MTPEEAFRLAEKIVADLFVNGNGEEGQRLVITDEGPPVRHLGGWGRLPTVFRIAKILQEQG